LTTSRLLEEFRAGDRRACGRLLSLVENEVEPAALLSELYPLVGRAGRVGVTGPPGAGKSTLVEKLAAEWRRAGKTVGIVAVDPTSPFSGGAVLGDRVRMSSLFTDPGVYIRSMATRGGLGGLAVRTKEACDVLDAFGRDVIIIETVGVGQMELDIAEAAHTTVVVLVPESGDSIQALKAGLMEIADVYCVNKSDREGADRLVLEIEAMLELRPRTSEWVPPVVKTVATSGAGVAELHAAAIKHRLYLEQSKLLGGRREQAVRSEILALVDERLRRERWQQPAVSARLAELVGLVLEGRSTPYSAAEELLRLLGR
jgi:LAO/AO transport system kinase